MAATRAWDPQQLIAFLNAIRVGALEGIRVKLAQARQACLELAQPELADLLTEAEAALAATNMKIYRKRIETVVARLGHLK